MTSSRDRALHLTIMKYTCVLMMMFAHDLSRILVSSSAIMELTDHTFGDYSKSRDFLMVNFYAPWCSDSKVLSPELEKTAYSLGRRSTDIVKVDCFGKGRRICEIYGIKHWPTLKTFRHGVLNTEYMGSHHAESILNYINGAEDMISGSSSSGMVNTPPIGPVLETALNNNNNDNNSNNNSENSATKSSTCESGSSNSKSSSSSSITSPSPAGSNGPTATYEKPEIVPASSYATAGTSEVGTAVAGVPIVGTVGASAEDVVTITPNGKVEVGPPPLSTTEKVASLAAAAALITQPSDVINQLECAKCKIMTPVQRSQSSSCRQYKRSCIPQRLSDPADKLAAIKAAAAAKERYDIDKRQRLYF